MADDKEKEKGFWDFMLDHKAGRPLTYLIYAIIVIALIVWQVIVNN